MNIKRSLHVLACLLVVLALSFPASPARAATYTVTSTANAGAGTLRQAILDANAHTGADTIEFDINPLLDPACNMATGVCTIRPLTQLPFLTDNGTTINGYTQDGAQVAVGMTPAEIRIQLSGSLIDACTPPSTCNGLNIASANNHIRGLSIIEWDWNGIAIGGTGATDNVIAGNYLGVEATGTTADANVYSGVFIGLAATNNTIGGDEPAERNVISGNTYEGVDIHGAGTTDNIVSGNYIGIDETGASGLGNGWDGVRIYGSAGGNLVGGDSTGERNLISGNDRDGVRLVGGSENIVSGNTIGLNIGGTASISNGGNGILITNGEPPNIAVSHTVGGDTLGERNIISGNFLAGVSIDGAGANFHRVIGNFIGTNMLGTAAVPNLDVGVEIKNGAAENHIGGNLAAERNLISGNHSTGVLVTGEATAGTLIRGNWIGINSGALFALPNSSGIVVQSAPNTVIGGLLAGEGNVISGNDSFGIVLAGPTASGTLVAGNLIGLNPAGAAAIGNGGDGIHLTYDAYDNIIGTGNVISGNNGDGIDLEFAGDNTIIGNRIGTNAGGTTALPNNDSGIHIFGSAYSTIGGSLVAEQNILSGNALDGINIEGSGSQGNTVRGNIIGLNANGTAPLGNEYNGVYIHAGAHHNTIGGGGPGQGNVISANIIGVKIHGAGSDYNILRGNIIGMAHDGTTAMGNTDMGVSIVSAAKHNEIGGDSLGEGNLISGNDLNGISISDDGTEQNIVTANRIGVDATGTLDRGNGRSGVYIQAHALYNRIGGSLEGERNLISGNQVDGIYLNHAMYTVIAGNYIGVNLTGTAAIPNQLAGIELSNASQHNTIGGSLASEGNLISGNGTDGILLFSVATSDNTIQNNRIGVSANSLNAIGNGGDGVKLNFVSDNIVTGDVIAHNLGDGVSVTPNDAIRNQVRGVRIFDNSLEGIALYLGANDNMPAPIINSVEFASGLSVIQGAACPGCAVELFAGSTNDGQGEFYLGTTTADPVGVFSFSSLFLPYPFLTATATDPARGTSMFSAAFVNDIRLIWLPVVQRP